MLRSVLVYFSLLVGCLDAETVPDTEQNSGSPLSPAEAAASISLPEGFIATVFAAEPDVRNPIDFSWDSQGRLWIAENYTYERRKDVTLPESVTDRVLIFSDDNGDGAHDSRAVFLDGLRNLTSIEWAPNGLYVLCPPRLLFFPDANGDDQPDGPPKTLLNGFTIPKRSSHNFANGLRWGPDGWLYGRCGASAPGEVGIPGCRPEDRIPIRGGIWRYHPDHQIYETLCHGTTNPWGHDWNEDGELFFINTVNGHFFHLIEGAHYKRGVSRDPNPYVYQLIGHHADHWHLDTKSAWHKSRDGVANDFGGGHAHVGMVIYQGDNFPEKYHGSVFTLNLHGRRCNRETLHRKGSGYVAKHAPDFFLTKDPFFRGVELTTGPDGGMYVLDWSDTGECHENTGVHRNSGRIFKITYGKPKRAELPRLDQAGEKELRELSTHPNIWHRRMAELLLRKTERKAHFITYLDHVDSTTRREDDSWRGEKALGLYLLRLRDEPQPFESPQERLRSASLLQQIPHYLRPELARMLLKHREDADDHNIPLMIWYGLIPLAETYPRELADLVLDCQIPLVRKFIARRLAEDLLSNPENFNYLLGVTIAASEADKKDIITGLLDGTRALHRLPAPKAWSSFISSISKTKDQKLQQDLQKLAVLFGDGRALEDIKSLVLNNKANPDLRRSCLETLIRAKHPDLKNICRQLLNNRDLNATAAEGLAGYDDPEIASALIAAYPKFHESNRSKLVAILASRSTYAQILLESIAEEKLPRSVLSAYHLRQIQNLQDQELNALLNDVWGQIRKTPEDKAKQIAKLRKELSATTGSDRKKGRVLYQSLCATCHQLHGKGGIIGPDLTGSGRQDLDYLLHNIIAPSAEVSADYQVTILTFNDGRTVSGRIASETDSTISLISQDANIDVLKSALKSRTTLPQSLMPEGLLDGLSKEQIRDLIAYLRES